MAYITKKQTTDGIKPIGSNLYGTCATASGTAAKVVIMSDFDVLVVGVTIHVYFTYGNTASNPTLKVGNTNAVPIRRNGSASGKWESGSVTSFTYDGSYWTQNDADNASSTTYGITVSGGNVGLQAGGTVASKQYLHISVKTVAVNCPANGIGEGYLNVAETGYTAIGVVGWNLSNRSGATGVSYCYPFSMTVYSNQVRYQIKNTSSSIRYVTLEVRVLYIPS